MTSSRSPPRSASLDTVRGAPSGRGGTRPDRRSDPACGGEPSTVSIRSPPSLATSEPPVSEPSMSGPTASEPVADRHLDRAARVVDGRQVAAVVLVEDVADAEVHAGAVEPLVVGPPSHEQVMDGIAGGGNDPRS